MSGQNICNVSYKSHNVESTAHREVQTKLIQLKKQQQQNPKETVKIIKGVDNMLKVFAHLCQLLKHFVGLVVAVFWT